MTPMVLWPRSLLWRTFALLALLVLATTAGWFLIFRAYEVEPRARQLAQNLGQRRQPDARRADHGRRKQAARTAGRTVR